MTSYRDLYGKFSAKQATIIAISADKQVRQAQFRRELGAEFSFVADTEGALIRLFGVKTPLVTLAKRTTFVIGKGRSILAVEHGRSSVDASGAAEACSLW